MKKGFTIDDIKNSPVAHLNKHLWDDQPKKKEKKKSKYNNQKVEFDGHSFDSLKERDRYITLRMLRSAGEITDLCLQVEFELNDGGTHSLKYIADFCYTIKKTGEKITEDVKGYKTLIYKKKCRLMKKVHGITILEV